MDKVIDFEFTYNLQYFVSNYRDVIFQEISWFQKILLIISCFQEILPCTEEEESTFFQEIS